MDILDKEKISTPVHDSSTQNPWVDLESTNGGIDTYEIDGAKGKIKVVEIKLSYIVGVVIFITLVLAAPWNYILDML